jgi:hypothetical protein
MYRNLSHRFPEHENRLRCRSFTKILPDTFSTLEPHCNLSLLRPTLWNNWLKPRIKNKVPPEVIVEEIGQLLSKGAYKSCNQTGAIHDYSKNVSDLKKALSIP